MKRIALIIALLIALPLAALAAASTRSISEQILAIDITKPIVIDFGDATVNIIAWQQDYLAVSHTERSVREGMRGEMKVIDNTLLLEGYVAPTWVSATVSYSVDSWLPLLQFPAHHQAYMNLPEADYNVYVPAESVVDARAKNLLVFGCNITSAQGEVVWLVSAHLLNGFTGHGNDINVRDSSGEGRIDLRGQSISIRNSKVVDIFVQSSAAGQNFDVEIRDAEASRIIVNAPRTVEQFDMLVRDTKAQSLTMQYDGTSGQVVIRDSIIQELDNQTKLKILER